MDQFSNATRSIEFQKLVSKVMPNVLQPLSTLINVYSGPNKLIEKRSDKLLDYEGALSDLELKKTNNIGPSTKEVKIFIIISLVNRFLCLINILAFKSCRKNKKRLRSTKYAIIRRATYFKQKIKSNP